MIAEGAQHHTNGRNGGNNLSELKLVKNSSFTSRVETYHKYTHFLLGKQPTEQFRK